MSKQGAIFAGCFRLQTERAGTWRQPRLISGRVVETCAEQVLRAPPVIQARIRRWTRFRDSEFDCLSSRGSRKTRGLGVMFHVKQFLFLPVFHGKQSCFSVRQAAARPISSSRCHSDAPTQSCCQRRIFALDLQAVVSIGRQSSFLLRESSDYNCG